MAGTAYRAFVSLIQRHMLEDADRSKNNFPGCVCACMSVRVLERRVEGAGAAFDFLSDSPGLHEDLLWRDQAAQQATDLRAQPTSADSPTV